MIEERERMRAEQVRIQQENYPQPQETLKKKREADLKKPAQMDREERYNEVKDKFVQQKTQIKDSSGQRWVQCTICHEIKEASEFGLYGGENKVNLGECSDCLRKQSVDGSSGI